MKRMLVVLALAGFAGCETIDSNGVASNYLGLWKVKPDILSPSEGVQTRKIGQLLFVQNFRADSEATFVEPVSFPVPWALGIAQPPDRTFAKGAAFERVLEFLPGQRTFCDPKITYVGGGGLDPRRLRACFQDTDVDGIFDWRYWASSAGDDIYSPMTMLSFRDGKVSIPYAERDTGTAVLVSAGLAFTRRGPDSFRLAFAVNDDESPQVPPYREEDAAWIDFRANDIPATHKVSGAEIEIMSISGEEIRYRVKSGFDQAETILIGYQGNFPRRELAPSGN